MLSEVTNSILNTVGTLNSTPEQHDPQRSTASLLSMALAGNMGVQGLSREAAESGQLESLGDQVSISPEARRLLEEIRSRQATERQQMFAQDEFADGSAEANYRQLGSRNKMLQSYNLGILSSMSQDVSAVL